jgi:hypothetical protein
MIVTIQTIFDDSNLGMLTKTMPQSKALRFLGKTFGSPLQIFAIGDIPGTWDHQIRLIGIDPNVGCSVH